MIADKKKDFGETLAHGAFCKNAALDAIKLVAVFSMLLDHLNAIVLLYNFPLLWWLGRLAFPLFCLVMACNLQRGSKVGLYLWLLIIAAIISQPVYARSFVSATYVNTLFTLAAGLLVALGTAKLNVAARATLLTGGSLVSVMFPSTSEAVVDFGLAGILLPAAFQFVLSERSLGLVPATMLIFSLNYYPQAKAKLLGNAFADAAAVSLSILIGIFVVLMFASIFRNHARFIPGRLLYFFYPAHLLALDMLRRAIS